MRKYPLSNAEFIIETAANAGFEGLRAFTLVRELPKILLEGWYEEDETYDEFIDRLASACWMGSNYFRMWLGDENVELERQPLLDLNLNHLSDGVYYMSFDGDESHYWVWIIDKIDIWYAGTYGGICGITVEKFNKVQYSKRFINAMNGSLEDYGYIFQVKPEVEKVGFTSIDYMKSNRY